jgi:hypothetical protein
VKGDGGNDHGFFFGARAGRRAVESVVDRGLPGEPVGDPGVKQRDCRSRFAALIGKHDGHLQVLCHAFRDFT